MPFRHSGVRGILPISWVREDVVGSHWTFTLEGWGKHMRGSRVWELGEVFSWHPGDRIKGEGVTTSIGHVVEESPEACSCEAHTCIGDDLDQPFKVKLGRDLFHGLVQGLKMP